MRIIPTFFQIHKWIIMFSLRWYYPNLLKSQHVAVTRPGSMTYHQLTKNGKDL